MKKVFNLIVGILLIVSITDCKKPSAEVTGIIEGMIINSHTSEPIRGAIVTIGSASSKTTGDDGKFRFEGLEPKEYIVQVKADEYETNTKTIIPVPGEITTVDISLTPLIPILSVSASVLNFGMSETILPLTIVNNGKSELQWSITENIPWLSTNPVSGVTTSQPSGLNISIDRTSLSPRVYSQSIIVNSNGGNAIVTVNMTVQGPVPTAILTMTPQSGTSSQVFQLDASASTDDVDPTSSLMARWKWEDALQFSDWSTIKTASQQYIAEGVKNITLEIRDSQGNVGTAAKSVIVNNALTMPTLATNAVTNITASTANCGGNIFTDGGSSINRRGVCWSTNQYPTIAENTTENGTGLGSFTSNLSGLISGTTYFVRAYAINDVGTNYGNQVFFKAGENATQPSVTTSSFIVNNTTSITCTGNVISAGTDPVSSRGFCWNSSPEPNISGDKTTNGSGLGVFQATISNLTPDNLYYIRAYATNSVGTSYGEELSFLTSGTYPSIETKNITNILETTAIAGGVVLSDGGSEITERGVCYSTFENPTIYDTKVSSGTGIGSFAAPLSILIPSTSYYVRAYAINEHGTVYGENKSFTTLNAYYTGFETGMPTGWSGMWYTVTDNPFEGYYSLYSIQTGDAVSFTRTISNPDGGVISFEYMSGTYYSGYSTTRTYFYIDNVQQAICNEGNWSKHTFPCSSGTHTFKWINNGWAYNGQNYGDGSAWIDYVICTE
ncbi:MAG: carboxypeptidase regulatory-like domain-containing protein [Bacteroidales bacterium]